jgi:putative redox protein
LKTTESRGFYDEITKRVKPGHSAGIRRAGRNGVNTCPRKRQNPARSGIIQRFQREKGMKARIKWVENVCFVGESGSGHALVMDGAPEGGGRNLGMRPMETVLIGTGGCTAYDVVHILKKSRAAVTDCVVEIDSERAAEDPKVFTKIHFHFVVTGKQLKPQQVERAIHLSAEKYCSASIMLAKTATITHDFEIREA